jgi:hypothetical protein
LGAPKENCKYVVDEETSNAWDAVARDVEKIRREHPGGVLDIPG